MGWERLYKKWPRQFNAIKNSDGEQGRFPRDGKMAMILNSIVEFLGQ